MSRVLMPRTYMATIFSLRPPKRRECLAAEPALAVSRNVVLQTATVCADHLAAGAVARVALPAGADRLAYRLFRVNDLRLSRMDGNSVEMSPKPP